MAGPLSRALAFPVLSAVRVLGLGSQLGFVLLAVQLSHPAAMADYFTLMAFAAIFASVVDIGFVRYSFRLLRRLGRPWVLYRATILVLGTGSALGLPMALGYMLWMGLDTGAGLLLLLSAVGYNVAVLSRHVLILRRRLVAAVALEAIPGAVQLAAVTVLFPISGREPLGIRDLAWIYAGSILASILSGILLCGSLRDWMRALHPPKGQDRPIRLVAWHRLRRSLPLCLEYGAHNAWLNLPVLGAALFGTPRDVAVLGVFLRGLGVVRAFGGVLEIKVKNHAYDGGAPAAAKKAVLQALVTGSAGAVLAILLGALVLGLGIAPFAGLRQIEAVALLLELPAYAALAIPILLIYAVLGTFLMGRNRLRRLAGAMLAGLAGEAVLLGAVLYAAAPDQVLPAAILGMLLSGAVTLVLMLKTPALWGNGRVGNDHGYAERRKDTASIEGTSGFRSR